jgi:hypothetical protein
MKTLLVVFGVMIMFVFVIGDALVGYLGGSRGGSGDAMRDGSAVAVKWDGDSLSIAELENLKARRHITNAFQEQVHELGARAAYMAGLEPRNLRVQPLVGPDTAAQGIENSVVHTRLFADAARAAGMHVSDELIVQYLDELGRGNVTRADMRSILEVMQKSGWRVSIETVIEALREEMLARNYLMSHLYAFQTITPQQRWRDWLSVNDRVVVEAAAIPAESFLIDVPEPTEAELNKFFNEPPAGGNTAPKDREAQPDLAGSVELPSATPGFRIPRKIDLQFVQAKFEDYFAKVEDQITDEEIAKYYEENKDLFIKADTGHIDDEGGANDAASSDEAATENATTDETGALEPGAATDEDVTNETSDESPATLSDPATESAPPAESNPAEESEPTSDSNPPEESQPSPPPAEDSGDEATPDDGKQSLLNTPKSRGVFRQVAFLQEADAESAAEAESAEENPAVGEESAPAEPPATPATETEAPATPVDPAAAPADTADATTSADAPSDEAAKSTVETPPSAAEKPKQYQPLEEVSDLIRRDLAQRRVTDQLNELMDKLMGELNADFNAYFGEALNAESENRKPPAPPASLTDLAALAEKHGLTHDKTGPMPWLEMRNTPVGKSGNRDTGMRLSTMLFGNDDTQLYQPVSTVDIDGNRYISLKTSDTPGRVPKLDEVRADVVRAWKLQKAADLALKDAQAQAKKAQESGSPLTDFFADKPDIQVVRTDPFAELTRGDAPDQFGRQRFRLSQPDNIVAAGPEFLGRIFELKDGEVGALLNHDRSIAYVVRIVEHQNSKEELRNAYLSEAATWDGRAMMTNDHTQIAQQLLAQDVTEAAGLKWERPRDQPEKRDEDDEDEE